jgi:predicted DNA-binding protein with PD1-like motif
VEKKTEKKESIRTAAYETGRCFLGRMDHGADLITAVEGFCMEKKLETAVFSMIGALTSATLGAYDQKQQVYVTCKKDGPLEIVHCTGNVSFKEGKTMVHAHAVLADMHGTGMGGHLFSESRIFAGEIFIRELVGPRLNREYDEQTGLWLWADV